MKVEDTLGHGVNTGDKRPSKPNLEQKFRDRSRPYPNARNEMKPLTQGKLDHFRESWQERATREQRRLQRRRKKGRTLAGKVAQLLVDRYDAGQVYLTGSLAEKETVHEQTDIDLVVRGLEPDRYFSALAESCRLLSGEFHLDLIPYEDANEAMRQSVQERGELLAETR